MSVASEIISSGRASLGIELGSTRIKACLVGESPSDVLAVGSYEWENQFVDGLWTYDLADVWTGLAAAMSDLRAQVSSEHGTELTSLKSLGISAMMHGYLAFDKDDNLLVPFRTWRNTNTGRAAEELTSLFGVNIPLRWSIAHLHQVVLEGAEHVPHVSFVTTLAGYVHWKLTGEKVLGIGDASGMFPINTATNDYDATMVAAYDALDSTSLLTGSVTDLLPRVLVAGEQAGVLTAEGAALLDPTGGLTAGALVCPPEGDAGTGMVATNAVAPRTGNISAGTSIFAMVVLERPLKEVHHELDVVTTPTGDTVAMVHCNNGASELAAWVGMFRRFAELAGSSLTSDEVYDLLFQEASTGEPDAGGLVAYNYLAGEPITGTVEGRPLFVRTPDSDFSLGNAIRAQLYGVFGTLSLGMRVLEHEGVELDRMSAHGGMFRTAGVAGRFLAAAINAPVSIAQSASEGGAWGIAVLAAFAASDHSDLASYLDEIVFKGAVVDTALPEPEDVAGFAQFLDRYRSGLPIEQVAATSL